MPLGFHSSSGTEARGAGTFPAAAQRLGALRGGQEGFAQSRDMAHAARSTAGIASSRSPRGLGWTSAATERHRFCALSSSSSARPGRLMCRGEARTIESCEAGDKCWGKAGLCCRATL